MNDHRPCDVCGQPATTTDGICGADLCDDPVCYGTAWDHAFADIHIHSREALS